LKFQKIFVVVALLLALPALATAQTCKGSAALDRERPVQIGGGIGFIDGATDVTGGVRFGGSTLYATASGGRTSYDNTSESSRHAGFSVGGQVAADSSRRIVLCPEAGFEHGFGTSKSNAGRGGLSAGFVALERSNVQLVPTAGVAVNHVKFGSGISSYTTTYGTLDLGTGIVMSKRFSIVPFATIPFGNEGASKAYGMGAYFSIGK
jgi:hypothetical protein